MLKFRWNNLSWITSATPATGGQRYYMNGMSWRQCWNHTSCHSLFIPTSGQFSILHGIYCSFTKNRTFNLAGRAGTSIAQPTAFQIIALFVMRVPIGLVSTLQTRFNLLRWMEQTPMGAGVLKDTNRIIFQAKFAQRREIPNCPVHFSFPAMWTQAEHRTRQSPSGFIFKFCAGNGN